MAVFGELAHELRADEPATSDDDDLHDGSLLRTYRRARRQPVAGPRPGSATFCDTQRKGIAAVSHVGARLGLQAVAQDRASIGASPRHLRVSRRSGRIDWEQADLIASAFLEAPRTAENRTVRAAYAELSLQARRWFVRLTGDRCPDPVRVAYTRCPEPYRSACDLSESVRSLRVLELSPALHDHDRRHPLLDTSVGGAYDCLRAVHDIVSHGWCRFGFDRHGEFSAWLTESRINTGLARWALATELHGEHSVRWTSGYLADHKALLLELDLLSASPRRGLTPTRLDRRPGS